MLEREKAINEYHMDCVLLGLQEAQITAAVTGFAAGWDRAMELRMDGAGEYV